MKLLLHEFSVVAKKAVLNLRSLLSLMLEK